MATQRVADDDDAFVLDEGLNEADEELVAFGATDAAAATRRAWADVDAEYHVSERVSAARASAGETVATVDAQLHVRERVGDAVPAGSRGGTPRREDSLPSPGGRRGPHEP